MALTKLTKDLIDGTIVTSVNGSTGVVTLETGTGWQATPKTASFTAVAGEGYFVDTTSAAITVTLPSSPTAGDEISLIDYGANASTNNITITSSDNIEGAADDLVLSTDKVSKALVYSDATKGWLVSTEVGGAPPPSPDFSLDYFVVAGGGGGGGAKGGNATIYAAGGGGGGYKSDQAFIFLSTDYTVTLGAGGAGGVGMNNASNGTNSVFNDIIATSGFGGGSSGGGNSGDSPSNNGGSNESSPYWGGGGGAGANSVGSNGSTGSGGNGGNGLASSITGSSVYYAGGGGGSAYQGGAGSGGLGGGGNARGGTNGNGNSGTPNTGGGGGAAGAQGGAGSADYTGGAGGSGIVILRYPDAYTITIGAGLTGSTTTDGSDKVTTFTSGTGNISFS